MPELQARLKAGWVLMTSFTSSDGTTFYFLERGKTNCVIELELTGHGILYINNEERRI